MLSMWALQQMNCRGKHCFPCSFMKWPRGWLRTIIIAIFGNIAAMFWQGGFHDNLQYTKTHLLRVGCLGLELPYFGICLFCICLFLHLLRVDYLGLEFPDFYHAFHMNALEQALFKGDCYCGKDFGMSFWLTLTKNHPSWCNKWSKIEI